MDFIVGGLAAVGAGFFTNPLEVVKIRMQLQGELNARGQYEVQYKNMFQASYKIAKHDGLKALQAGLIPAQLFQLVLNGTRLGAYDVLSSRGFTRDKNGKMVFYKTVLASGMTGVFGAVVGSPFYLVKTHLQAKSASKIAFGHQHNHEGTWQAFKNIYKEQGIKGLFRGSSSSIPRLFVGCASQITSFDYCKQWLNRDPLFANSPLLTTLTASFTGGIVISLCMTPFDLIATRLYNQGVDANGKGLLYKNYLDCVRKIWQTEGFLGFYKGLGPSYLRLGPHTVLCLVFWDQLKDLHQDIQSGSLLKYLR